MPKVHPIRVARKAILTSLSASAAGLVVGAEAQADVIVADVNTSVGFGAGDVSSYTFTGLPGASFQFFKGTPSGYHTLGFQKPGGAGGVSFRIAGASGRFWARTGAGKTYNQVGGPRHYNYGVAFVASAGGPPFFEGSGVGSGTLIYSVFKFTDTTRGGTDYGYVKGIFTDTSFGAATYELQQVVYDNTGASIATGFLPASVPEPSSLALSAIGAMVMGAAGVRKWKKDKAAVSAAPPLA